MSFSEDGATYLIHPRGSSKSMHQNCEPFFKFSTLGVLVSTKGSTPKRPFYICNKTLRQEEDFVANNLLGFKC